MGVPFYGGVVGILTKRSRKIKTNRDYAMWANMFPVQDDCVFMESQIEAAQKRYATEAKEFRDTKKGKFSERAKQKRQMETLGDYINDMKAYQKDLKCGIVGAMSSGVPTTTPAVVLGPTDVPSLETDLMPGSLGSGTLADRIFIPKEKIQVSIGENGIEVREKKPFPWLWVGVAVAAVVIGVVVYVKTKKN